MPIPIGRPLRRPQALPAHILCLQTVRRRAWMLIACVALGHNAQAASYSLPHPAAAPAAPLVEIAP